MHRNLPDWFPIGRVIGAAEGGGWVLRVTSVSKEADRLRAEGWRINMSKNHILARWLEDDPILNGGTP